MSISISPSGRSLIYSSTTINFCAGVREYLNTPLYPLALPSTNSPDHSSTTQSQELDIRANSLSNAVYTTPSPPESLLFNPLHRLHWVHTSIIPIIHAFPRISGDICLSPKIIVKNVDVFTLVMKHRSKTIVKWQRSISQLV